jgi:hypothetical protein
MTTAIFGNGANQSADGPCSCMYDSRCQRCRKHRQWYPYLSSSTIKCQPQGGGALPAPIVIVAVTPGGLQKMNATPSCFESDGPLPYFPESKDIFPVVCASRGATFLYANASYRAGLSRSTFPWSSSSR